MEKVGAMKPPPNVRDTLTGKPPRDTECYWQVLWGRNRIALVLMKTPVDSDMTAQVVDVAVRTLGQSYFHDAETAAIVLDEMSNDIAQRVEQATKLYDALGGAVEVRLVGEGAT
jgi:hypothetical protein